MKIKKQALDRLEDEVLGGNGEDVMKPFDDLISALGLANPLAEFQLQLAALLAERGLAVDIETFVYRPQAPLLQRLDFEVPAAPAPLDLKADTLRALSVQQPWVDMILSGEKNVEYRSRRTRELGPLLLHASGTKKPGNFEEAGRDDLDTLPYRALVGVVDVVDVVPVEGEEGLYGWLLAYPRRFRKPISYSGAAGIFRVPTGEVRRALQAAMV